MITVSNLRGLGTAFLGPNLKTMKYLFSFFITIALLLLLSSLLAAQPGMPTTPAQAPIDGGLGLLAAAGGAYAFKKLRSKETE